MRDIHEEVKKVMDAMNLDRMPSRTEIEMVTRETALVTAIGRHGGFIKVAREMGIDTYHDRKHSSKSIESIEEDIVSVIKSLGIGRMPSRSEIMSIAGNGSLHNFIVRTGGYYDWADRLGLDIKTTETSMGKSYEKQFITDCFCRHYQADQMPMKNAYDVLVEKNIKVDVKSSRLYDSGQGKFFTFNLEKKNHNCDIFAFYCCNDDLTEHDVYIVPSCFIMGIKQFSVGEVRSKYRKFKDRWDFIDMYKKHYESILSTQFD